MAKSKDKEIKKEKADLGPLAAHERWLGMLVAGDHRGARAEALKALAAADASDADKAAAREVLQRTSPDRGTLGVGLVLLAVLLVIAALVLL